MYQAYRILDGDTLESISNSLNVSKDEIFRLNGISNDDFVAGNLIVLPKNDSLYFTYVVRPGDSMYDISKRYSIDLDLLYRINGIKEGEYIYPNQEILIPKDDVFIYITKDNETISDIVNSIDVSFDNLFSFIKNLYLLSDQAIAYKRD